jgi:prevent-host-death family protein
MTWHNEVLCSIAKLRYNMTMVSGHGSKSMPTTIAAGEFKAKCLKLMDEVAQKRKTLVITKHGKPVVQLIPVPAERVDPFGSMKGSVIWEGDIISPIDVEWEAMK